MLVSDAVSPFVFDSTENALVSDQTKIKLFDKVKVQISVEEAGGAAAQRSKVVVRRTVPNVPGLAPINEKRKQEAMELDE